VILTRLRIGFVMKSGETVLILKHGDKEICKLVEKGTWIEGIPIFKGVKLFLIKIVMKSQKNNYINNKISLKNSKILQDKKLRNMLKKINSNFKLMPKRAKLIHLSLSL